jgi:hypothetical protein
VALHEKVGRNTAADFLRHLVAAVPFKVHGCTRPLPITALNSPRTPRTPGLNR